MPSRPPPAERTAEDQPFYLVPRHHYYPRVRVDLSSASFSINASQLLDQEALVEKPQRLLAVLYL